MVSWLVGHIVTGKDGFGRGHPLLKEVLLLGHELLGRRRHHVVRRAHERSASRRGQREDVARQHDALALGVVQPSRHTVLLVSLHAPISLLLLNLGERVLVVQRHLCWVSAEGDGSTVCHGRVCL